MEGYAELESDPAEVCLPPPLVPVMVINDLEQVLPMAKALLDGGISVFEITLRTPVALDAIALIAKAMPDAMVGAGTVLNCAQFDAAVAAGAPLLSSPPGMTPALLYYPAEHGAVDPGGGHPVRGDAGAGSGYDHLKFFPAEANGGTNALSAIAAPPPQVKFCPTGGIGPKNVADYLALKWWPPSAAWMLPADAVKSGNWEEVTRLSGKRLN